MSFVPREQATGTVDGVNKTFTVSQNIFQIDQINVDGIDYLGSISVSGDQITLGDAPQYYIYVWYYTSAPPSPSFRPNVINVQQALQDLQMRLKDITDVPQATAIQWMDFIQQQIYRMVIAVDPERYIKTITFPVTSGVSTYALPADFRSIDTYNTGLFLTDGNGNALDVRLPQVNFGSQSQGYYITGNNIVITPNPPMNQTYQLRYIPTVAHLYNLGDYFTIDKTSTGAPTIPGEYERYLVEALVTLYATWDEDAGAEALSDQRFVRAMDELLDAIRRPPSPVPMLDFSQIYNPGGGGGSWWGGGFN